MELIESVRHLYHPLQPAVRSAGIDVTYREWQPHKNLQPFVYCYWELKTNRMLDEPFNYRVVADGCIDIFFEVNDPSASYVMGFCRQYEEFPLERSFHYMGIRFLPTMFPQFFQLDASELSDTCEKLQDVAPEAAEFLSALSEKNSGMQSLATMLDDYLMRRLSRISPGDDRRIYQAVRGILTCGGILNIERDLDVGVSPRQLRRLFEYYIGDTPKVFAQVVQFQHLLHAAPSLNTLIKNRQFLDAGYYDQAHFIKTFKKLYGTTPSKA